MKAYFSIQELLDMRLPELPMSKSGMIKRVKEGAWQFREVAGRGGKGGKKREYMPPPEVQAAIMRQQQEQVLATAQFAALPVAAETETETLMQVYGNCTQKQRDQADARVGVVRNVLDSMETTGKSMAQVVTTMLTLASHPDYPHLRQMLVLANDKRGGGGEIPSSRTVVRWVEKAKNAGGGGLETAMVARVPEKAVKAPDWVPVFTELYYLMPQKPSVAAAFEWFLRDWRAGRLALVPLLDAAAYPSVHQARRWIGRMGSVSKQRGRMGPRELKTQQGFVRRKWQDYLPLDIVVADGQCFDAECGHPDNPSVPIRPEITLIVDVGTRRIVGVGIDTAESGRAVRGAVAENSPERRDRFAKVESEEQMFLFLPQEIRTVQRCEVSLRNNRYYSPLLAEYHRQQVRIAYNEHNAERVWVLDMEGRFIAAADWDANARDVDPKAVVEQAKDKRLQGQLARLDYKKAVIQETRPSLLLEHQDTRVNIGGLTVDMARLKETAQVLSLTELRRCGQTEAAQMPPSEPAPSASPREWVRPTDDMAQYREFKRLKNLPEGSLTAEQRRFAEWYAGTGAEAVLDRLQLKYG